MKKLIFIFIYVLLSNINLHAKDAVDKLEKNSSSAVVFMYHRFGNSKYPSTNIRLEQFRQHLKYIEENGFNVWQLSKIVSYLQNAKQLPPKTVAITVDDAYITTYTNGYPMLKEKSFPFTVFVNTNPVDNKSKNYMTWEQMREMSRNGVEFANHSLAHEYLLPNKDETKDEWMKRFKKELIQAQIRLQEELGVKTNENPKLFSYPFGEYNEDMANILHSLGYVGVAQESGVVDGNSDFRALPRFPMSELYGSPKGFTLKINTLPLPVESIEPWEPVISDENPPKLKLKLKRVVKGVGCFLSSGAHIGFKWLSDTELEIQANAKLKPPRDRYTCTAPAGDGKWYWYSHMWIIKD